MLAGFMQSKRIKNPENSSVTVHNVHNPSRQAAKMKTFHIMMTCDEEQEIHNIYRRWHARSHFTESVQNYYQRSLKKKKKRLRSYIYFGFISCREIRALHSATEFYQISK